MLHLKFVTYFFFGLFLQCHGSTDDDKISAVEYGLHSKKIDNAYDKGRTIEHVDTRHNIGDVSNLASEQIPNDINVVHTVNSVPETGGVVMGGNHVVKAPTVTGSLYSSIMNGGK